MLQCGSDETEINHISRLNLRMAHQDGGCGNEVCNMGTCKVLIDGTTEGVRKCVETVFKRGQIIVMRLRGLIAQRQRCESEYSCPLHAGEDGRRRRALRARVKDSGGGGRGYVWQRSLFSLLKKCLFKKRKKK